MKASMMGKESRKKTRHKSCKVPTSESAMTTKQKKTVVRNIKISRDVHSNSTAVRSKVWPDIVIISIVKVTPMTSGVFNASEQSVV